MRHAVRAVEAPAQSFAEALNIYYRPTEDFLTGQGGEGMGA